MTTALDPDGIGHIGEAEFGALCARAGLHCNKSSRDVMGWDYIVEFPVTWVDDTIPLDQRPNTFVKVQLKSTLGQSSSRIQLKLSAIDRLVKDPLPALIVVLRLSADGTFLSGYLVHLIGKQLARVLRRLRQAEADENRDINRANITFDYTTDGVFFEPKEDALLNALKAALGANPRDYSIEKQRQLDELGYEDGRLEGEALIRIEGPEHFSRVMLGLEPLKTHSIKVFDSRFGIRLPYKGTLFDNIEELRLSPPTIGNCEILIRGAAFGQAARFDGEMFIAPTMLASHEAELLIRAPDFIIRLTSTALNFESVDSIDDTERSLDEWAELLRALTLLASGKATLTIARTDRVGSMTVPVNQPVTGPYLTELPYFSAFLDGWRQLLAKAGLRSTAKFKIDALWETNEARIAVDVLLNPTPLARFEFQAVGIDLPKPMEGLYYNSTSFVDTSITFSAKVFFEVTDDSTWRYRSTRFEALDVRPKVGDLDQYGVDQATACDLKLLIDPKNFTLAPETDAAEASSTSSQ